MRQNRINNPDIIDTELIEKELKKGVHVIVQFDKRKYSIDQLEILNGLCAKYDESFGVRFYGHYSDSFDCNVLINLPDIKCLYVDCLLKADNVSVLSKLNNLKFLSIGIYELRELDILKSDNLKSVKTLIIGETFSKALDLTYLREYENLIDLRVCGHTKNIEAIGELKQLEELSLNSIRKNNSISFVNKLRELKSLSIILGGKANILEIESNGIENLTIIQVRGFNDISNIGNFKKLKTLLIQDQIKLNEMSFNEIMPDLSDLKIINCKSLNSLRGLGNLTSLKQLRIYKTKLSFEMVIDQKLPLSLGIFAFYTTKTKQDREIARKLSGMGYSDGLKHVQANLN